MFVVIAIHDTSTLKQVTSVVLETADPAKALRTAFKPEECGFKFRMNGSGIVLFRTEPEKIYGVGYFKQEGLPSYNSPIVFRRMLQGNRWVTEWIDQSLKTYYPDDNSLLQIAQ